MKQGRANLAVCLLLLLCQAKLIPPVADLRPDHVGGVLVLAMRSETELDLTRVVCYAF